MALRFAEAEFLIRRNGRKRLKNNTTLERIDKDTFGVKLHNTYVVKIHRDGTYTVTAGGWRTATTKDRINYYSPLSVYQRAFEWFVGEKVVFFDGIKADAAGRILNAK
jgi:hypothetical protein